MPNYTMTFGFLFNYIGTGLLSLFGNPLLLGLFLLGVYAIGAKMFNLPLASVAVVAVVAILASAFSGIIPEWIGYVTLVVVATLLAMMLGREYA